MPVSVSGSRRKAAARQRARDRTEVRRARRAVDHRQPVQQRRRADGADDQVLQPRLQRMLAAQLARAEHVERDRQELQPDEQRDRVLRGRQQRHAADRGQQQRVELAVRRFARRVRAPRQQHRAARRPRRGSGSASARGHRCAVLRTTTDFSASHCQIVRPAAAPSATRLSAGTSVRANPARARSARPAARSSRRRAARSAARAPRSRCAGLSGGPSRVGPRSFVMHPTDPR